MPDTAADFESAPAKIPCPAYVRRAVAPRGATRVPSLPISTDRDLLMQLLSKCLPLVDAAMATTALLTHYHSYADAIAAPFSELQVIDSVGEQGAHLLKCVHAAAIHLAAAPLRRTISVDDRHSLFRYLNTSMAREKREIFRALFLDPKNHVIVDQVMAEGPISSVRVSVRDIVERTLYTGASAVILLHNHPSGDPTPSSNDLYMTQTVEDALKLLDVRMHDHIIVGKGQFFSFKNMEFFTQ